MHYSPVEYYVNGHSEIWGYDYAKVAYIYLMEPGNRLRALRKAAGLTQGELGERAGFAQETISHYENDRRPMQLDHMRSLARALACSVADLLPEQDNPDRLTDEERALIHLLRNSDERQRATAIHMAEAALNFEPSGKRTAA